MKRIFSMILAMVLLCTCMCMSFAEESTSGAGNVRYLSGVTSEMVVPEYWSGLTTNSDEVLLSFDEIEAINDAIVQEGENTNVTNLESASVTAPPAIEMFERILYVNGEEINEEAVTTEMTQNTEVFSEVFYAVTVRRADVKSWPIADFVGYDVPTDPDDETQLSVLEVNSPVLISGKCTYEDHVFYFCTSQYITGWIDSESLAICRDKAEWKDSWKVELGDEDFIVVTQDKIRLEPMLLEPEISEVELMLGTKLKLVPESEIPEKLGEREGTLYNYVVYLPTRDAAGNYVKKIALIPERYSVSVGFLPFTQANLTKVAFGLLGNRYGWGGMLKSYDSSLFHRQVYSCFGLVIPTNTSWQRSVSNYASDISDLSDEEKLDYIKQLPIGTLLYMPGFSMQYIGYIDDTVYVIADAGVFADSSEDAEVRRYYTVSVMPLTVRRRDGSTFFSNLNYVLNFTAK